MQRISRLGSCAHNSGECGGLKVCTVNLGSLKGRLERWWRCCQGGDWTYVVFGRCSKGVGALHPLVQMKISISCGIVGVRGGNGVCIFIKSKLAGSAIEVERFGNRMMKVKMVLGKTVFHIFSVYVPQVGRSEEKIVWGKISDKVVGVPISEGVIVGGDANGYIGSSRV